MGTWTTATKRRRIAWLVILIADAGLLAWGAMAALAPERLPGPGSASSFPSTGEAPSITSD